MEKVDPRFVHLLQPIRDLTKNWDVEVATQLEEYLEDVDQICISFDNGRTTMKFVEAALLIQGSACIYSRKVEYLYTLVCQALDCISQKKRERLPCSVGADNKDADAIFTEEEEEPFLSLDDIRGISQASVDMRMDQQASMVNIVPLTPMSLVPPEEAEKKENPLLSRKGEILGSRKDFRMNTSTPHSTGAFLLELGGLSPTHLQQKQLQLWDTGGDSERGNAPVQALSFSEEAGAAGADDDDDIPKPPKEHVEVTPAPKEHVEAQRSTPWPRGYVLRGRAPRQDPTPHGKEVLDPWQSLDPFGDSEEKPFRKGKPFLVPCSLEDMVGGKRKRKGPRKLQDFLTWFSAAFNNVMESRKSRRKGPTFAGLGGALEELGVLRAVSPQEILCQVELELENDCGADCDEGADDDFVDHEDVEVPEEVGKGSLEPSEPSYEELVRRNVELFMANSQKYVQESALSQRIRSWEEHVELLLQEQ
ncbi:PREDICTED: condensin-2 complex subunit H2, partial [Acanthisitta chloris]|uniref:condensin-2 complex subunit H2 n=1 Tax=Acanthisitta chloris TaxID=57068 RepID=UPI0004F0CE7B